MRNELRVKLINEHSAELRWSFRRS